MKTMNHRKNVLAVMAVAAIVLGAQLALAEGGPGHGKGFGGKGSCDTPGGGGRGHGMLGPRMAERLDLTEEQQEAVAKIREEGRLENMELHKQMMRLRNEKQGEMLKDDPSEKTLLGLVAEMGKIRTELQSNRVKRQLAIRELLTPEQRDQMLLMRQEGDRGGRRGRAGRHGSGPKGHCCRSGGDCDGRGPGRLGD